MNAPQTSVDPSEVAHYTRLADTWWDLKGPFWPLHRLNTLRTDYICNTLCDAHERSDNARRPLEGLQILDVGCGGGILSEAMANLGATVHGIDIVERNIIVAEHHANRVALPICYELTTAEEIATRGVQYDAVLNMEVVEHVADLPAFMRACATLVKPSGVMVVATINRTLLSYLFAIIGAEYILRWLPRGTHQWRRFPKPIELENLLGDQNFHITARTGVAINPFTRRFRLSRSMAVNYMLVALRSSNSG